MKSIALLLICWLLTSPSFAAEQVKAPAWNIQPEGSKITWYAIQNDAAIEGEFSRFSGEIRFHPDSLSTSYAKIFIDMTSAATNYQDAQNEMQKAEWFDAAKFPQSIFEATNFVPLSTGGVNRYRAQGTLTIKGKSLPLALDFELVSISDQSAHIEGEAVLDRLAYGIGWADTSAIHDTITVKVTVTASR